MNLPEQPGRKVPWWQRNRRTVRVAGGFGMLIAGVPMLFLPAPGAAFILGGLTLLAQEYPWAGRVLGQVRQGVDGVRRQTERLRPGALSRPQPPKK